MRGPVRMPCCRDGSGAEPLRAQVLERCRRVYERDPFDSRKPGGEAQDLLLHFQQARMGG